MLDLLFLLADAETICITAERVLVKCRIASLYL